MISLNVTGCKNRDTESVSGTDFFFDTVVSFTVYGTEDESIIENLFDICRYYETIFSATNEDSELYKLNQKEISEVSEDLYYCMERAAYFSELLDGKYDISIRPVSKLWDFRSGNGVVPAALDIEKALEKVNYKDIEYKKYLYALDGVSAPYGTLFDVYLKEGMELDLGSAAKGYIGDRICEFLKGNGIESAIISLGGNVQCLGGKPGKDGYEDFRVAVRSPYLSTDNGTDYSEVLHVRNKAVVTSGIYERCFEKDGVLYHHILDAKTGYPVDNDLASVTIICDSGFNADILSTVCFLAGYEDTKEKYEQLAKYGEFEAKFYFKDGTVKSITASARN